MMVLGGLPLFLIELGIGQRLRTGPVGVWNAIHPNLGGIVAAFIAQSNDEVKGCLRAGLAKTFQLWPIVPKFPENL